MFRVYNTDYEFIGFADVDNNTYTEEDISTGLKTLCFQAPCLDKYYTLLQEEFYIESEDYNYVIKEVNYDGGSFFEVRAAANIEDIRGSTFRVFDFFEQSLTNSYSYCLQNTPWVVEYRSSDQSVTTYQTPNVNALDMIYQIAEDYQQELWFDTKEQRLYVYDKMGKDFGAYYSNELKLKNLKKQSSTYDYATVLIPIGKDGLTIMDINNGKQFLEDFSYSNKYIEKIWINEDYDIAEHLKAAAEIHLAEIAQPKASYKLKLSDLGEDVGLGDTVVLVDKIKRIKQEQRVVKITRYLREPEKSSVQISNLQEDFARDFVKQQKKLQKKIDYLTSVVNNLT